MHAVWTITKKELQSYFDSLIAYIMLVLFLGFSGFFTWLYGSDVFFTGQASLEPFFNVAYWTLFFFTPALTMRLLAEEKKTGTIELLLTKAVTDRQVVCGKFLSAFLLVIIALAFTFPYVFTLAKIGDNLGSVGQRFKNHKYYQTIFLDGVPNPSTLLVNSNGRDLPSGTAANGGVWTYDSNLNAIVFNDLTFAAGDFEVEANC